MLPTTWTALLLLLCAVLPGAAFTFALERQIARSGVTLPDRLLRLVAVSAVFDALYAWPAFLAYRAWFAGRPWGPAQFALAWVGAILASLVPTLIGEALGGLHASRTARTGWSRLRRWLPPRAETALLRATLGRLPAPRAWDRLFSEHIDAFLRVRTTGGEWIGGFFSRASYAGNFPNDADLLLESAWPIHADGTFGTESLGYPVYIPAATIAYVEVVPDAEDEEVRAGV